MMKVSEENNLFSSNKFHLLKQLFYWNRPKLITINAFCNRTCSGKFSAIPMWNWIGKRLVTVCWAECSLRNLITKTMLVAIHAEVAVLKFFSRAFLTTMSRYAVLSVFKTRLFTRIFFPSLLTF